MNKQQAQRLVDIYTKAAQLVDAGNEHDLREYQRLQAKFNGETK